MNRPHFTSLRTTSEVREASGQPPMQKMGTKWKREEESGGLECLPISGGQMCEVLMPYHAVPVLSSPSLSVTKLGMTPRLPSQAPCRYFSELDNLKVWQWRDGIIAEHLAPLLKRLPTPPPWSEPYRINLLNENLIDRHSISHLFNLWVNMEASHAIAWIFPNPYLKKIALL